MDVPAETVRALLIRAGYIKSWEHPHEGGVREQWTLVRGHRLSPLVFFIVDDTIDEEVAKHLQAELRASGLLGPEETP